MKGNKNEIIIFYFCACTLGQKFGLTVNPLLSPLGAFFFLSPLEGGPNRDLPACRRLLLPLLHAEKGRLRNAVANHVPASRWQGILFCINCEIISG